jgi:hypothetical protein
VADKVKAAVKIFKILVEQGELNRGDYGDLFVEYLDTEVQSIINTLEEEMECSIKKIGNTLYLLPSYDNSILGFRNKDWREWMGSTANNLDVYLAYYITMFILFEIYGGKNKNPKRLEFLRLVNLIDDLDRRFDSLLSDEEETQKKEEEIGLNLVKVARYWKEKIVDEENKKKTKYAVVKRICRLMENEKLIYLIDDDNEIRTTRKLDDVMTYYYLNDSRINEVNSIFSQEEPTYAQDKQSEDN